MAETYDTKRGIQNVQERVSESPSRQPVGERHLRGGKWGKKEEQDEENERQMLEEQEFAMASAAMVAEMEEEETMQSHIQNAIKEKAKKLFLKKALGKKAALGRSSVRWTLGIAFTAYLLQLFFAIGALVGLGLLGLANTNVITAFFLGSSLEALGIVCIGLGLMLSLMVLVGYLLYFYAFDIPILKYLLFTVICFAFSFTPGLSLAPWLLLWVFYMSLFSSSE